MRRFSWLTIGIIVHIYNIICITKALLKYGKYIEELKLTAQLFTCK